MKQYFLSNPVYEPPSGLIDLEKGIIHGVVVARVGPAKGHNGFIDKTFLLQVVELAAQRPQGIKARFGHPNMCATALGTYLGRFHNYAYHADKVTADLQLDESANNTPNGNLFEYVLNIAQTNPDMFGASLVFESAEFEKTKQQYQGKQTDVDCFRLKELRATDIVDDPAATDGLFSADTLPAQATVWLDQNPEIAKLIFTKPQAVTEFFNNYLNSSSMNLSDSILHNFRQIFRLQPPIAEDHADPISDPVPVPEPDAPLSGDNASISALEADHKPELLKLLSGFVSMFPDIAVTPKPDGSFTLQASDGEKTLLPADMSQTMLSAFTSLKTSLKEAEDLIVQLNSKLVARPTIPAQVSDPQVSTSLHQANKDEIGKHILRSIPPDMRYRLRKTKPTSTT